MIYCEYANLIGGIVHCLFKQWRVCVEGLSGDCCPRKFKGAVSRNLAKFSLYSSYATTGPQLARLALVHKYDTDNKRLHFPKVILPKWVIFTMAAFH